MYTFGKKTLMPLLSWRFSMQEEFPVSNSPPSQLFSTLHESLPSVLVLVTITNRQHQRCQNYEKWAPHWPPWQIKLNFDFLLDRCQCDRVHSLYLCWKWVTCQWFPRDTHQSPPRLNSSEQATKLDVVERIWGALDPNSGISGNLCIDPKLAIQSHFHKCVQHVVNPWLTKNKNYFTSCDPHHDIYTFCYWQIFWHSIWHIFWHSIWHIFWHSIWQILWHFIWHIFWHSIWHSLWYIFWHSIWPLRSSSAHWARKVPGWGPAVRTELGRSQVEVQRCALSSEGPRLRSSGAHWARKVPGWGPAVRTELGRSQVEVQRCALSWEGPRLRSSGAHWAGKVPGWGPAVRTELGRSQVEVQRCALSWEGPRLRSSGARWAGKVPGWGPAVRTELGRSHQVEVQQCALSSEVGEELGEELARRKWTWEWMQRWWRRCWRRRRRRSRRRRRRKRRRRAALIKSNNPHLAGGE